MARKPNPYFEDFKTMIHMSGQAAELLLDTVMHFDPLTLDQQREKMHAIEYAEDGVRHALMTRLLREFVTPIDREDIVNMANELDNLTDTIEDVLIRLFMYNVQTVPPQAVTLAEIIVNCCKTLNMALEEFENFQKSKTLNQYLIEVNTLEERGDGIYIDAMHALFQQGGQPLQIYACSQVFDRLEDCCDACEHVANSIERIVLQNV